MGSPRGEVTLTITPSSGTGLVWRLPGEDVRLTGVGNNQTNQRGTDEKKTISYQIIRHQTPNSPKNGYELRVPEHVLSALFLRRITDGIIEINKRSFFCLRAWTS